MLRWRSPIIMPAGVMLIVGTLLLDFAPLAVYRYLLVSDLLLIAGAILVLWRVPRVRVPVGPVVPIFVVFLAAHLVSMTRASAPSTGVFTLLHMTFLMLVFVPLVSGALSHRLDLRSWCFVALVAGAVWQAALVDAAVLQGQHWESGTRIAGLAGSVSAWLLTTAFVALAAVATGGRWYQRLAAIVGFLVLAPAVLVLRERMLWVAAATGCGVLLFAQARTWTRAVLKVTAAIVVLLAAYAVGLFPAAIEARIQATLNPTEGSDLSYRLEVVRRLASTVDASPLVGIGMGHSGRYLPKAFVEGRVDAIHNAVLHAGVEGGALAAASLVVLPIGFVVLWRRARRANPDDADRLMADALFASLIGIFVGAQFTPTIYEHVFYYGIALLASLSVPRSSVAA
jgi:O-antigen ligase